MLRGKNILLGVGGGIAAYRTAELARLLIKQGAEVRCVMTRSACEFITPLSFQALTGEKVHTELFDLTSEQAMGHIQLARWADAIIIAPATAGVISRLAHGIADDLLSTIMLVAKIPVLLAPAMNPSMWHADATRANVISLKQRGMAFIGPTCGELACGESGAGRLSEPSAIISDLLSLLTNKQLVGERWVINAGPTIEAWDEVRTLSNRATGTLGALLASQTAMMGADVTLIAGPGTPLSHPSVKRVDVESAAEMLTACQSAGQGAQVFIGTAAVSDFRFAQRSKGKIKRGDTHLMQVELLANPDIIAEIAHLEKRPVKVIAFAAEAKNHTKNARIKLLKKGVDAVIANDISNMGAAKGGGWFLSHEHEIKLNSGSKQMLAEAIIDQIIGLDI
ncbi:MAG: bifunctional phosphopantothenoylcysteine decarboxylase/phosphopantothenate--cysteine ligase CoaBC [Mariprofundus sp.]|nr:bifunctional phosphopantothenoylcysteine decarboxylase/phosphopantothenate--cysteine ligase CoaBC [Mariprofundus sp.]